MSPRRSSRARTTQPPPPPTHTNSSTSLSSLARADRNTRSNIKPPSPHESATQRSESIDDPDRHGRGDPPITRRSKRSNTNDKEDTSKRPLEAENEDGPEAEEITRCICGNAEYPGPPPLSRESGWSIKPGVKEEGTPKNSTGSDGLADESGNFFIQCDRCQVWEHGGCVGLMDESMSPDEYFCEECKPEYHKIQRNSNAHRSSRYLPVLEVFSPGSSTTSSNRDKSRRRDGKSRQGTDSISTKRRATMNSRDAAYDEDEMLRRAIEESRETGSLGKRTRDESEDMKMSSKRRRTSSGTLSPSRATPSLSQAVSEDESTKPNGNGGNGLKKLKGTGVRNPREKDIRERQKELAAQRAEAASKRNARSERRRGEESPPPTPTLSPTKAPGQAPNASHKSNAPDTPSHRTNNHNNQRKTGRPPARRGRLGRNQYTRDFPPNGGGGLALSRENSRGPTRRSSPANGVNGASNGINGESGRSSRPKYHHPNRTSMNEMKRRVAAILEFVSRMQGDKGSQNNSHGSSSGPSGDGTPNGVAQGGGGGGGSGGGGGGGGVGGGGGGTNGNMQPAALLKGIDAGLSAAQVIDEKAEREFRDMGSGDMMHILTGELVGWQSLYGKYGEK